jgi:hypothetical protein
MPPADPLMSSGRCGAVRLGDAAATARVGANNTAPPCAQPAHEVSSPRIMDNRSEQARYAPKVMTNV